MSFLNASTPDELRAAVRANAAAQAIADQLEAECADVRRLAPAENDFLRDELSVVVDRALISMDESHDFEGAAPVLTVSPYGYSPRSAERTRDGAVPIDRNAVHSCHQCGQSSAQTTPFWLALGRHVLQVDLCHGCAVSAIDRGARPQSLSIPDAVPGDFA